MKIQVRVASLEVIPCDTSGVLLTAEVCDASAFIESILRRPDDGVDSWALGARYQEVCDENRLLRERLAKVDELAADALRLISEPSMNYAECAHLAQKLALSAPEVTPRG